MAAVNVSHIEHCHATTSDVVRSPSSSYITNSVMGCVVNAIFAITGTILNSLVLFIFWKSPRLRKKITFFLIMILSSTDLAVTLVVHPLFLVSYVSEITGKARCVYKIAYVTSSLILSGQSALTLFTMNIERYLSIVHPISHRNRITKGKCVIALITFSFISTIIGIGRVFAKQLSILVMAEALIVSTGTCFVYIAIYCKKRKVLNLQSDTISDEKQSAITCNRRKSRAKFLYDLKMAKTLFLIACCSLICYLPAGIVVGIWTAEIITSDEMLHAEVWAYSCATINSTLNCLVFFWANKKLRQEWKKIDVCD